MTLLRKLWTSHSKYGVALLGVLTQAVSLGMLHGNLLRAAQLGIALWCRYRIGLDTSLLGALAVGRLRDAPAN